MKFNITAGVIERSRLLAFETMLWRVSKGNVFLKFADIYEQMEDPNSGNKLYKAVFMVFFQGDALRLPLRSWYPNRVHGAQPRPKRRRGGGEDQ